ncbi:MAG TPA: IPT/TIG domain-containing protein [Candidatus Alistipes intestinigallinarum]|uniref:IPT/TIG domain-containing protein n=1 Tax=Candidatus Alistipes intestinigallinarum TaxID=2838440 RepID=A0A9D2CB13_9BACT|nr:IPT/TIG domain-containing protein [Candidatus Alistipes intestinigallinarum]
MKRFTKYLTLFLTGSLAALTACGPEMNEVDVQNNPAINSTTLSPMTDESGSVRAYVGTEISVGGFNLDRVSHVTVDGLEAEITEKTIKILKFKIPALDLAQQDAPYQVWMDVYDADGESVIFHYPYYVTIPVTDALITAYAPAEGTVGTVVTLTGRNLEQITRVHFGAVTVEASAFTEVTAEALKFAVPAGEYEAGDSQVAITAEWGTATIDVTGETLFTLHTPKFDAASQEEGTQNSIGDEVTFTGQNLDLVSGMKWGEYDLIVVLAEAEAVTVRFPSSIAQTDPVVAEAALTALWGEPAQTTPVASAWRVDTTPVGPAAPVLVKMEAEDGGESNKFYLGKTVTVTGENLASIEGFKVDGVEAALVGEPTDISAQFIVPDGVTFTEAKEVPVVALYNGGNEVDFGTAMVYPFYYYKGIRLGIGSNSSSTYTEYAADNAFFYPDLGRVVSTYDWYDEALDPYAKSGNNTAISGANKLDQGAISADEYYAVKPYIFFKSDSSDKLALSGCANSYSQIKTHCRFIFDEDKGKVVATPLPAAYGTPIVMYRVVTSNPDPILNGTLTSMDYDGTMPSSGAPSLSTAEAGSNWVKGSVLVMSYVTYAKGAAPEAITDFAKIGYIIIRDVTCADLATGKANADRAGYIEFDMYWSKTLNE